MRDPRIREYLKKRQRQCKCDCTDGCWNPKTCPCYKFNSKLRLCTYTKEERIQQFDIQSYRFVEGQLKSVGPQCEFISPHYEVDGESMQVEEKRYVFVQ